MSIQGFRGGVKRLIGTDAEPSRMSRFFDIVLIFLIALSTALVIFDTFEDAPGWYKTVSVFAEPTITIIFTVEYLLRLWVSEKRLRFVFSPMAIIDLIAILPWYLGLFLPINASALRVLRVIRLIRLLKIGHYTDALSVVARVLRKKASQLTASLIVIGLLLIVASTFMYLAEQGVQPDKFPNALSGLWWAVVTITTVGYGDVYPITFAGKVLGAAVALLGVGLVAVPTGIISAGFTEESMRQRRRGAGGDKPSGSSGPLEPSEPSEPSEHRLE